MAYVEFYGTSGDYLRLIIVIALFLYTVCHDRYDSVSNVESPKNNKYARYLLYDVNPGEGFNLRRDVYMRVANLVTSLNVESPWILVLPPWSHLYHWQTEGLEQSQLPWSTFFDVDSLNRHVPVMEFNDFMSIMPDGTIDEVYYLQRYDEEWKDGEFEEKFDERPCIEDNQYFKVADGTWEGFVFDYFAISTRNFKCLSFQGHAGILKPFLLKNATARSVFFDRAETILHDMYGGKLYWEARRSMRYAKHLRDIADEFRRDYLSSTDESDKTSLEPWWQMKRKHGDATGGPYMCAHLRRKDYLYAHKEEVPSLKVAAKQLDVLLRTWNLTTLFISSDMPDDEFRKFRGYLTHCKVLRYVPTTQTIAMYKDGGIAIIDQWICAHARFFIGTHESTFSFRIQEDREILGFKPELTFNRLCPNERACEQPSKWFIAYDDNLYWH